MDSTGREKGRIARFMSERTFVFVDYIVLAIALIVFFVSWFAVTKGSNVFVSGSFYTKGFKATYQVEGATAKALGSSTLELETVAVGKDTATVRVITGDKAKRLEVDRKTARVLQGGQTGVPLVFYYDVPREPGEVSATFGDDNRPNFSTDFTGLRGRIHARVKNNNADNVVMWYHTSPKRSDDPARRYGPGTSYGPQFSWELPLKDDGGRQVGTIVNDLTSGLLLDARFYQDGLGTMNLTKTNYPTAANRWAVFYGFNVILILWGVFHVLRARRHPEEWKAHWSYFPLDFVGISRFFIRLLAFTLFDFMGVGFLTGNLTILLISDIVGFLLMVYAVGVFAFPVLFKFIPWFAAFLVFAGGRPLDYVQYPFGVPLYLISVVSYMLYRYLSYRRTQREGLNSFLEKLPEVTREAVVRELESASEEEQ